MNHPLARVIAAGLVFIVSFTTVPLASAQQQQPAPDQPTSQAPPPSDQSSQSPDATAPNHQPPVELPENPGRGDTSQPAATTQAPPSQPKAEPNGTAVAPP